MFDCDFACSARSGAIESEQGRDMKKAITTDRTTLMKLSLVVCALSSCIAPPAEAPTSGGSSESAASPASGGATTAAASTPPGAKGSNTPAAVKPTGLLLSDGASDKIQGVDPPGSWFVFNDRTAKGVMTPASTPEFGATAIVNGAVHSTGKGFSDWGGGIGFNFVGADIVTPLDASGYSGLSFQGWGKGAVHVALATMATMPDFGTCTKCYDHFAVDIELGAEPKTYSYKWSQLHAAGWGAPKATLDTHTLIGLNFTSKGATPWDFSIKDIRFLP
jgi:hypothetical protein